MRQDIGRTNQELKMSINGLNLTAEQLKMNIGWNGTSYLFKSPEIDNRGEKTGTILSTVQYMASCTEQKGTLQRIHQMGQQLK